MIINIIMFLLHHFFSSDPDTFMSHSGFTHTADEYLESALPGRNKGKTVMTCENCQIQETDL